MKMFSVILSNYNQEKYIYEAIDSILIQDYENIELIISDDASDIFEKDKIISYVKSKRDNICLKFVINENNIGTVATYNKCLKKATGEYLLIFAADDRLNNNMVLSNFANYFNSNKNVKIVTSVTNLFDEQFINVIRCFPDENEKKKLKVGSAYTQNKNLYKGPYFAPGATAYRKELFDILNGFDNKYYLIEDWSNFLRCTRLGYKVYFIDSVSLDHRGGGISETGSMSKKVYDGIINDTYMIYEEEIFKNLSKMSKKDVIDIVNRFKIFIWYYGRFNLKFLMKYVVIGLTNFKYFSYLLQENKCRIFAFICSMLLTFVFYKFIIDYLLFLLPVLLYVLFEFMYILISRIFSKYRRYSRK